MEFVALCVVNWKKYPYQFWWSPELSMLMRPTVLFQTGCRISQLRNAQLCAGVTRSTMSQCEWGRKFHFIAGIEKKNQQNHIFYLLSNRNYTSLWRKLNWHMIILSRYKLWQRQEIISSWLNLILSLVDTFVEGQGLKMGQNN